MAEHPQVNDNLPLLEEMLVGHQKAAEIYQTTNYWKSKNQKLISHLRVDGLRDFRSPARDVDDPKRAFLSFGAADAAAPLAPAEMMKLVARHTGGSPAATLQNLPASTVGAPIGFVHEGNFYTNSWLNYYLRYAYVARFIDLSGKFIVEIGPGSGKQAHLLKLAHPDCTIALFDIPPQAYVANQYLQSVLGEQFIGYDKTKEFTSARDFVPGKVHLLCNWQITLIHSLQFDLLWNAASFQEMEPDVVTHYLHQCFGASKIYLMQAMHGQVTAKQDGDHGVMQPTTLEHYRRTLKMYRLTDLFAAPLATPVHSIKHPYYESFWVRRDEVKNG